MQINLTQVTESKPALAKQPIPSEHFDIRARRRKAAMAKFQKVPVTILTGFLGSGKTTLLNHILTSMDHKRFAVIENEFGDVGIDDALLKNNMRQQVEGEELIEMMNGCICCTVRAT
ncbi:ATP binding protein [Aureococcus anophagefferens]|nr:ATP binding protein [Aureococcus anophagefferens]